MIHGSNFFAFLSNLVYVVEFLLFFFLFFHILFVVFMDLINWSYVSPHFTWFHFSFMFPLCFLYDDLANNFYSLFLLVWRLELFVFKKVNLCLNFFSLLNFKFNVCSFFFVTNTFCYLRERYGACLGYFFVNGWKYCLKRYCLNLHWVKFDFYCYCLNLLGWIMKIYYFI